ncbi:unnamed protein product [Cuscuta campestris]|uniref:Uncharacterized protein n=1 Tax=Cuscuta campestris TaxID=132261 RepID=A0A484MI02_9ASTE|nr:unnamed protein product [Cuscuta campestris]
MAFILGSILRYQTILLASHALFRGIADTRAARGDAAGAARARSIARALDRASGLGLWGLATNPGALMEAFGAIIREVLGGDLVKDVVLLGGSGLNDLIKGLNDLVNVLKDIIASRAVEIH